jgi:acyl-coenzyme A synthetase/AMP-(fatty) acid ligase
MDLDSQREIWWHEALADPGLPTHIPPEPMDAEDPLFILYTSGSTGKPKGGQGCRWILRPRGVAPCGRAAAL